MRTTAKEIKPVAPRRSHSWLLIWTPGCAVSSSRRSGAPHPKCCRPPIPQRWTRSGCRTAAGVGFGGADAFAATHPFDADSPHQPGDLIAADVVAGATCCFPQLASPVDTVVVLSALAQRRTQHRVAAGAC